jgi:uncharacterized protein YjbI with pentapeptide repeats
MSTTTTMLDLDLLRTDVTQWNKKKSTVIGRVNLRGADLHGADLRGVNLYGVDLYGADLHEANLAWSNLAWSNLAWTNLRRVNLYGVNLAYADLREADLRGAILHRANLPWVKGCVLITITDDGYHVLASRCSGNDWVIHAGCHQFSVTEAIEHWSASDYHTPRSGRKCVAALKWFASEFVQSSHALEGGPDVHHDATIDHAG